MLTGLRTAASLSLVSLKKIQVNVMRHNFSRYRSKLNQCEYLETESKRGKYARESHGEVDSRLIR